MKSCWLRVTNRRIDVRSLLKCYICDCAQRAATRATRLLLLARRQTNETHQTERERERGRERRKTVQTDMPTNRQTDRLTDIYIYIYIYI